MTVADEEAAAAAIVVVVVEVVVLLVQLILLGVEEPLQRIKLPKEHFSASFPNGNKII